MTTLEGPGEGSQAPPHESLREGVREGVRPLGPPGSAEALPIGPRPTKYCYFFKTVNISKDQCKNRTPHNRHSKDETATFAFIYKSHTGVPKTTFECSERPSYKCRIINIPQVFDSLLNGRFPHFWTALEHPQKSKFWFRSNAIKTKETSTNVPFQDPYACISHSNCNGFALLDFLPNRPSQDPSQERKSKRRANTIETNEKSPKVPPESIPNEHNC